MMQAAGRLRQLERGQSLRFVGSRDITDKIRAVASRGAVSSGASAQEDDLTSQHVLQWVMHNTVQATLAGIMEWTRQGLHFAVTRDAHDRAFVDEVRELTRN